MAGFGPIFGGELVGYVGHAVLSMTVNPAIDVGAQAARYAALQANPVIFPDIESIVHAYYCGFIPPDSFQYALGVNGVDWSGRNFTNSNEKYWYYTIEAHRPHFDIEFARRLYLLDGQDREKFDYHVSRNGFPDQVARFDILNDPKPLATLDYASAWLRGLIDEGKFQEKLRVNGVSTAEEIFITKELTKEIPGPSEIVHFVLRHGFEPSVIRANRLNEEFPAGAREWLGKLGFNYAFNVTDPFTGEVAATTWADMYWQTHWVPISPGQAYTMLQRIREDNINDWRRTFPGLNPFTLDDVRRWLRINDYPPGIRDYLAAISYNPIGRIDIRRAYQTQVITANELPGLYQNIGYSPSDSQKLADFTVAYEEQRKFKLVRKDTESKIKRAYLAGVLNDNDLLRQLYRLQLETPADVAAFDAQDADTQLRRANNDAAVRTAATSAILDIQLDRVNAVTKLVRKRVLGGFINAAQAEADLSSVGIVPARIADLLLQWRYELQNPRRDLTVAQLIGLASKGIIGVDEALLRLVNLGYSELDSRKLLAKAQIDLALTAARDALNQAKTASERQKALIATQRAAQSAQRAAQQALAKYGSPSKLVYWYQHHLIEMPELQRRLRQILSRPQDLLKWEEDAISKRSAQDAKDAKKGITPGQSTTIPTGASGQPNPPAGGQVQGTSLPVGGPGS